MKRAGRCESGKFRYRTELDAKIGLAQLEFKEIMGDSSRRERRAYKCPSCRGWHLTSKMRRSA